MQGSLHAKRGPGQHSPRSRELTRPLSQLNPYDFGVCRNIRPLYNFDPPATQDEVHRAALQYVRKISGSTKPSRLNTEAFERAVDAIADISMRLLNELVTSAPPKDREIEAAKARERAAARYG